MHCSLHVNSYFLKLVLTRASRTTTTRVITEEGEVDVTETAPTVTETAPTSTEEAPTTTETAETTTFTADAVTETAQTTTITASTQTVSVIVRTTGTLAPVETGIAWKKYSRNPNPASEDENPVNYKFATPDRTGYVLNINQLTSSGSPPYNAELYDGSTILADYTAIIYQGYFLCRSTGTYTFFGWHNGDRNDDQIMAWLGNDARNNNWSNINWYMRSRFSGGDQAWSQSCQAGQAIPITIFWTNNSGRGAVRFFVRLPNSTVYVSTAPVFFPHCPGTPF